MHTEKRHVVEKQVIGSTTRPDVGCYGETSNDVVESTPLRNWRYFVKTTMIEKKIPNSVLNQNKFWIW